MSQPVNVLSIEAIATFRAALARFGSEAGQYLTAVDLQLDRELQWIADMVLAWRREVARLEAAVGRAKQALQACLDGDSGGGILGCLRERRELARLQRALEIARAQLRNAQLWNQRLNAQAIAYRQRVRPVVSWLEQDLLHAEALLRAEIGDLQRFTAEAAPGGVATAAMVGDAAGSADAVHALVELVERTRLEVTAREARELADLRAGEAADAATAAVAPDGAGAAGSAAPDHTVPPSGYRHRWAEGERGLAARIESGAEREEQDRFP